MMELVKIGEKSYYINSPVKIGIYKADDRNVYMIDSGGDKDTARKARKILDENGWILKAIINTHCHADHIGGNRYLQQQMKCKIFANGIEAAFTSFPILEASFLYGGYPCKDLRHKFLLADKSDVTDITDDSFPKELEIIPLPGHFFDMIGIRTPDNTVFLADCISSKNTLEKYQISFMYDVAAYLKTLDMVEGMEAKFFVPSHAQATKDIKDLIYLNRDKIYEIAEKLILFCSQPLNFEVILQKVFKEYHLKMNFEQYVLVGSTIRSYLSWLKDIDKITVHFNDNQLLWQRI